MRCALLLVSIGLLPVITACNSVDSGYGYSRPYVALVALPTNLDETERDLLPDVEDALEDAGYRTTFSGGAEYELDFDVESGPINTDVRMRLFRGRQEIVGAYSRSGGARSIFRRGEVVRDAFEKCLDEFESRLPRPARRGTGQDQWRDEPYRNNRGYDDRGQWNRGPGDGSDYNRSSYNRPE